MWPHRMGSDTTHLSLLLKIAFFLPLNRTLNQKMRLPPSPPGQRQPSQKTTGPNSQYLQEHLRLNLLNLTWPREKPPHDTTQSQMSGPLSPFLVLWRGKGQVGAPLTYETDALIKYQRMPGLSTLALSLQNSP